MTKEEQRHALINAIADADPDDVVPHRIYADFLEEQGEDDSAEWHRRWTPEVPKAMKRIEAFAASIKDKYDEDSHPTSYDTLMAAAARYLDTGEDYCLSFTYEISRHDLQQFWQDYEIVTCVELGDRDRNFFRCAC